MKSFKKIGAAIVALFIGLFILVGCGDKSISYLEIKSGTFAYEYEQGEEVKWDDLVILAKYNDSTVVEVAYGDEYLTISEFDTSKTGNKEITFTYKKKNLTITVKVKTASETTLLVRDIAALPDAANITLDNKTAVDALKARYDVLSAEGKQLITNYAKLEAAVNKIAALELASYKTAKKAELVAYKAEVDYSATKWNQIQGIIAAANSQIDAAANKAAVDGIVTTAKADIDAVPNKVNELRAYKDAAKTELTTYQNNKGQANYSSAGWNAIRAIVFDAKDDIDVAATTAEVDTIVAAAKADIDAVSTYKQEKKAELASYKQQAAYTADGWAEIQGYIATANTAIDNAANNAAVDEAVATAKAAIDAVMTAAELERTIDEWKTNVDEYADLTDYNPTNQAAVTALINQAKEDLDGAANATEARVIYNAFKAAVDAIKKIVVTNVEDAIRDLPDLADITAADKTDVDAVMDMYNALSETDKNNVENRADLLAADLKVAKEVAKAGLGEGYLETNYNPTNWAEIQGILSRGRTAIDALTDKTEIAVQVAEINNELRAVKIRKYTDVEDAIKDLPNPEAFATMNSSDLATAETAVDNARNAYEALGSDAEKAKIDAAAVTRLEDVLAALAAKKLSNYKAAAKQELKTHVIEKNEDNYVPSKWAQILSYQADGEDAIDAAANEDAVDAALATAKSNINGVSAYDDQALIYGVEVPRTISIRRTYIEADSSSESGYYNRNAQYVVGNANVYNYPLDVTAYDPTTQKLVKIDFKMSYELLARSNPGTPIDATNSSTYTVVCSSANPSCTYLDEVKLYSYGFKFSSAARNNYFAVRVGLDGAHDTSMHPVTTTSTSPEFKVLDGFYNITEAKQLSVMVNSYSEDWDADASNLDYGEEYLELWNSFRASNDIVVPSVLNGIILQNDIAITPADLPAKFTQGGYLGDYLMVYSRSIHNETFTIEGNYYTLNASTLPIVDLNRVTDGVSHSSLFTVADFNYAGTRNNGLDVTTRNNNVFNIRNISIVGNVPVSSNPNAGFGAMITYKTFATSTTIENTQVRSFYINFYVDGGQRNIVHTVLKLHNAKSYDAYQSHVMGFGGNDVYISASDFARCGGPDILANHKAPSELPNAYTSIYVDAATRIQGRVNGNSNWFAYLGQTGMANQIVALDAIFDGVWSQYEQLHSRPATDAYGFVDSNGNMNLVDLNMESGMGVGAANAKTSGSYYRYSLLSAQPSDFADHEENYYKLVDNVYVPAEDGDVWAADTYYERKAIIYMSQNAIAIDEFTLIPDSATFAGYKSSGACYKLDTYGNYVPVVAEDEWAAGTYYLNVQAAYAFGAYYSNGAPVFVADNGVWGYFNGTNDIINPVTSSSVLTLFADPNIHYVTLYYNGLAIMLEYFTPAA